MCVRVCVGGGGGACGGALRIDSTDKILCFINTFIIIIYYVEQLLFVKGL